MPLFGYDHRYRDCSAPYDHSRNLIAGKWKTPEPKLKVSHETGALAADFQPALTGSEPAPRGRASASGNANDSNGRANTVAIQRDRGKA